MAKGQLAAQDHRANKYLAFGCFWKLVYCCFIWHLHWNRIDIWDVRTIYLWLLFIYDPLHETLNCVNEHPHNICMFLLSLNRCGNTSIFASFVERVCVCAFPQCMSGWKQEKKALLSKLTNQLKTLQNPNIWLRTGKCTHTHTRVIQGLHLVSAKHGDRCFGKHTLNKRKMFSQDVSLRFMSLVALTDYILCEYSGCGSQPRIPVWGWNRPCHRVFRCPGATRVW